MNLRINIKNKIKFVLFACITSFAFVGCDYGGENLNNRNWKLVWQDEFDVNGDLDETKWTYDIGRGDNGWGNGELQYYTDRPENVTVNNGFLVISAKKEDFNGASYTSARIKTQGLFNQQYGRFEARIRMPYGQGIWPAFWLLGSNIEEVGWPNCGEIDIMEFRGQEPTIIHGSLHGPGYSGGNPVTDKYELTNDRYDTGFHTFAVEWGEDYIDYFVDDILYQTITPSDAAGEWVFDNSFFMILNVAVGGSFIGNPNDDTVFPQHMLVDYVRVYKQ